MLLTALMIRYCFSSWRSVAREELGLKKQELKRRNSDEDTQPMKKAKELLGGIDSAIDHETD